MRAIASVFFLLIAILVAFGFGGSELMAAWDERIKDRKLIDQLTAEVNSLKQDKKDLEAQIESLRKEIEALKARNQELEAQLRTATQKLDETSQKLSAAEASLRTATATEQTPFAGPLGWIVPSIVALAAGLKNFFPGQKNGLIADTRTYSSNSYVQLTPDETRQLINQRRKRRPPQ